MRIQRTVSAAGVCVALMLAAGVVVGSAPLAGTSAQQEGNGGLSAVAGQQLARAALLDLRVLNDEGPGNVAVLVQHLRDAATLDPANASLARLWLDAAERAGNRVEQAAACRALLKIDPTDTPAQLALIISTVEQLESVEERLARLETFLGPRGDSLDPSVRSRLALMAALLCRERADAEGFVRNLTQATTLDSSNRGAAALALEFYASRGLSPEGRFELLVNTLISSPTDPMVHGAIAEELSGAGATQQAFRFAQNAAELIRRQGDPVSAEDNDIRSEQKAALLVLEWKLKGPEGVIKQLNDAIDESRRQAQMELDVAGATGKETTGMARPESFRLPVALERVRLLAAFAVGDRSTLDRSLVDFAAAVSALPVEDPSRRRLRAELAYLNGMVGAGDMSTEMGAVRAAGADPSALARMEAWQKHRTGNSDGARAQLQGLKDDALALFGLAVIDESRPPVLEAEVKASQERLLALATGSGSSAASAWAHTVFMRRNAGVAPPVSARGQKYTAMAEGIPSWVDDAARDPQRVFVVKVDPAGGTAGLSPLEPARLSVRISNNTPVYVSVGPGDTIDNQLMLRSFVDLGGLRKDALSVPEVVTLGGRLRLAPREEAVFTVWADVGLGWRVQNALTKSARLRFTVMQGYIVDNDGAKPGPFSSMVDAAPIVRGSVQLGDPARLVSEIATLQGSEFGESLLQARLALMNSEKPLSQDQQASLIGAVIDRYKRGGTPERVACLTLMPTIASLPGAEAFDAAVAAVDEKEPLVSRAALLTRVGSDNSVLLAKYSGSKDESVQAVIRAMTPRLAETNGARVFGNMVITPVK